MELVLVEWVDSHSSPGGWLFIDDIIDREDNLYCRSVGWIVKETEELITLVPHIAGEVNGNLRLSGRGDLTIPCIAITKMVVLRKK